MIGVPSDLSEEDVTVFVVAVDGHRVDVADLDAHLRTQLTGYKVPRYYEVVAGLPHTPTGRLAKHKLPVERTPGEVDMEQRRSSAAEREG